MTEPTTAAGRALLADRIKGFEDDASNRALPSRGTAAEVNRAMLIEDWTERILTIEAEAGKDPEQEAAKVAAFIEGSTLDADLIQRIMFNLVGTAGVPDLDNGGIAFLAHREFAELFAAEYARLEQDHD